MTDPQGEILPGLPSGVYNIPAGVPFADALAATLLKRTEGKPEELAAIRLLLPTRRACRTMRETFLRMTGGKPLLLPRMQPLGDVEEEELALELGGAGLEEQMLALPPAISKTQRQILLARAIMARETEGRGPAHALTLAAELGHFLDRIHTENLDMAALPQLVGAEFARHWEITLDFLRILGAEWPVLLQNLGAIEAADRRNRLLAALAAHWRARPPAEAVIAAGSTGSIPAAGELLSVIARLPRGAVVLPGLDDGIDEESWDGLDDQHPQFTLKQTLTRLDTERDAVRPWPCDAAIPVATARRNLAREMLRPAATAGAWAGLSAPETRAILPGDGLTGLMRCDCDTPQEEAQMIALLLRETLETPGMTAALVTPDRKLARRVAASCRRWGITLDDSAGQALPDTRAGAFLRLVMQAVLTRLAPGALLSVLRHDLCRLGLDAEDLSRAAGKLEAEVLRGAKPPPGIEGLRNRLAQSRAADDAAVNDLLNRVEAAFAPLTALMTGGKAAACADWLAAHIGAAEALAAGRRAEGRERLWAGEDGGAAAQLLSQLREEAAALPDASAEDYQDMLAALMKNVTVRPHYGTHPRLSILGQLEARLLQPDLVILGGLNEGTWPPDPGHDPWMSRPMMAAFGLPPPERRIGMAAHDFVQGFCAPRVVMTRAKRVDGVPAVPSRWLQRLDTVLEALGCPANSLTAPAAPYRALARMLERPDIAAPVSRPAPCPPVALRPRELPVTGVETWTRDPYGIYARYILRLRKLEPLEKKPDAAERGTLLHEVMAELTAASREGLPPDTAAFLCDIGSRLLHERADDPGFWDFWWPRFVRLAEWIAGHEDEWRRETRPEEIAPEKNGSHILQGPAGPFTLTARADRIDRRTDGTYAVIDYKSGGTYTPAAMRQGDSPQLPLEALILQAGGFAGLPPGDAAYLGYWVMTGGTVPGQIVALADAADAAQARDAAREGLEALIALFDKADTPYYSLPDPDRAPRFNDYEHLARVQEWAALDEAGGGES